jgi:lactoylglutathione lyase
VSVVRAGTCPPGAHYACGVRSIQPFRDIIGVAMATSIVHIGIWTHDLERLRSFYVDVLGGESGPRYENARTGFRSYFISFGSGARLELMQRPSNREPHRDDDATHLGFAHVALALGSREAVEASVARLESRGTPILGRPRLTGDGYYEAVVADPDGNRIELVA